MRAGNFHFKGKYMAIKQIEEMALQVLKIQKTHLPQAIIVTESGMHILGFDVSTYDRKMQNIQILKEIVRNAQSELYYVIFEAFVTEGNKKTGESSRKEALVVTEYSKKDFPIAIVNTFSKTESGEIFLLDRNEIYEK
jgi:predicted transcriptional regulator